MTLGGHRKEDVFWVQTLTALGHRLGAADTTVTTRNVCVDTSSCSGNAQRLAQLHGSQRPQTFVALVTALRRRG
jgi:hypothetical protein